MPNYPDYYKDLGVKKDATEAEIKRAYLQNLLKYHPDKNVGVTQDVAEKNRAMMDRISAAYQVLSNRESRADYDKNPHLVPGSGKNGRPPLALMDKATYQMEEEKKKEEKEKDKAAEAAKEDKKSKKLAEEVAKKSEEEKNTGDTTTTLMQTAQMMPEIADNLATKLGIKGAVSNTAGKVKKEIKGAVGNAAGKVKKKIKDAMGSRKRKAEETQEEGEKKKAKEDEESLPLSPAPSGRSLADAASQSGEKATARIAEVDKKREKNDRPTPRANESKDPPQPASIMDIN